MRDDARELALFLEAIKVSPRQRGAFLTEACAGDEELRRRMEALLGAHDRMGDFLEAPPGEESSNENN